MKTRIGSRTFALLGLLTPLTFAAIGGPSPALAQQPAATPAGQVAAPSAQIDPRSVSLTVSDLRPGFALNPDPTQTGAREPSPGLAVYEADFTRERTTQNLNSGPVEIKSLVARAANPQQATEQFNLSRQSLTAANPPWVASSVATLGDEAVGLSLTGNSAHGPAVAHLYLFRQANMVVGVTVSGLEKQTRMAEAEALSAVILRRIDPTFAARRATNLPRTVRQRPPANAPAAPLAPSPSSRPAAASVRVSNTDGTGLNLRASPSTTARIMATLPEGTTLEVIGEDRQVEGRAWKNVRSSQSGTGWVAAEYTTPVTATAPSGTPSAGQAASTPTPAAATQPAGSTGAARGTNPPPSTGSAGTASAAPGAASAAGSRPAGPVLAVDVAPATAELAAGAQTLEVTVTRDGRATENARATIEVRYVDGSAETLDLPPTDGQGRTRVTWTPGGPRGQVGVGVVATAPDGTVGVGSASFRLQ